MSGKSDATRGHVSHRCRSSGSARGTRPVAVAAASRWRANWKNEDTRFWCWRCCETGARGVLRPRRASTSRQTSARPRLRSLRRQAGAYIAGRRRHHGANRSSITLTWGASTDNVGVVGYAVDRNGTTAATTAETRFTLSGLVRLAYSLAVHAYDRFGNQSPGAAVIAGTSDCRKPSPSPPPSLHTSALSTASAISVEWRTPPAKGALLRALPSARGRDRRDDGEDFACRVSGPRMRLAGDRIGLNARHGRSFPVGLGQGGWQRYGYIVNPGTGDVEPPTVPRDFERVEHGCDRGWSSWLPWRQHQRCRV